MGGIFLNPKHYKKSHIKRVCCTVLHCVAVCRSLLQCVAVCGSVLHCVAVRAVCLSALQCAAVRCSALQCIAVYCSVQQCITACCIVLQCVAVCCSVLQLGTLHRNERPHITRALHPIIYMWRHSFDWHDTFTCVRSHSRVPWLIHAPHDSFIPSQKKICTRTHTRKSISALTHTSACLPAFFFSCCEFSFSDRIWLQRIWACLKGVCTPPHMRPICHHKSPICL